MEPKSDLSVTQAADRFRRKLKLSIDQMVKQQLLEVINDYLQSVYDAREGWFTKRYLPAPIKFTVNNTSNYRESLRTLTSFWMKDKSKKQDGEALTNAFKEADFTKGVEATLVLSKFNRAISSLDSEFKHTLGASLHKNIDQVRAIDQALQALADNFFENLTALDLEMEDCREMIVSWTDKSPLSVRVLHEKFPEVDVAGLSDSELPDDVDSLCAFFLDSSLIQALNVVASTLLPEGEIEKTLVEVIGRYASAKKRFLLVNFTKRFHDLHQICPAEELKEQVRVMVEHQRKLSR